MRYTYMPLSVHAYYNNSLDCAYRYCWNCSRTVWWNALINNPPWFFLRQAS